MEIFDSETDELVAVTYYGVQFTGENDNKRVVATKPSRFQASFSMEEVGDIVVINSNSYDKTIPHAIGINNCKNLIMEDVTLYASNSFGFFEQDCTASQYTRCQVDRRPMESETAEREYKRLRSLNADAYHSKFASIGPTYRSCLARYNGDDGININGHYHLITESTGTETIRVIGKFGEVPNIVKGDTVELVTYDGDRLPDATVVNIEVDNSSPVSTEERSFIDAQRFSGDGTKTRTAEFAYVVTLDRTVSLPKGSVIASSNKIGNGFKVDSCIFGPNRSRGIIAKASNGIIANNRLVDNWGHAIKVSPEYKWLEAGSSNNITITNNVIMGCHDVPIGVYTEGGDGGYGPSGGHHDITITKNTIMDSANPGIFVTSTTNLVLGTENIIKSSANTLLLEPYKKSYYGRREDPNREVYFINVDGVSGSVSGSSTSSTRQARVPAAGLQRLNRNRQQRRKFWKGPPGGGGNNNNKNNRK